MDIADKITGSTYTATEWTAFKNESQNSIESAGITLSAASETQLAQAINTAGQTAHSYQDGGVADAYTLTRTGVLQQPTAYIERMRITFTTANMNTGATTVNVSGLGVKNIVSPDGSALIGGEIIKSQLIEIVYDSGSGNFVLTPWNPGYAFKPVVDPRWYGAAGDGTTNDQTILQSIITNKATDELMIIDLKGLSYVVDNLIITGQSNIEIHNGKLILGNVPGGTSISLIDVRLTSSDIHIHDIVFDSKNSTNTGKRLSAITIAESENVIVERCTFEDCFYGVFTFNVVNNITVSDNIMNEKLPYSASNETNLLLQMFLMFVGAAGISTDITFEKNHCNKIYTLIYSGIDCDGLVIDNNYAVDTYDSSIYTVSGSPTVTNNTVIRAGKDGIKMTDILALGADKCIISNNIVDGAGYIKSDGGVSIQALGTNALISCNVIKVHDPSLLASAGSFAIVVRGTKTSVNGNVIDGPGAAIANADGILLDSDFQDVGSCTVSSNEISDIYYGIQFSTALGNYIRDSKIDNNIINTAFQGIRLINTTNPADKTMLQDIVINSNQISGTTNTSIYVENTNRISINNNVASNIAGNFMRPVNNAIHRLWWNVLDGTGNFFSASSTAGGYEIFQNNYDAGVLETEPT